MGYYHYIKCLNYARVTAPMVKRMSTVSRVGEGGFALMGCAITHVYHAHEECHVSIRNKSDCVKNAELVYSISSEMSIFSLMFLIVNSAIRTSLG
jgi:hypothetical protein